MSRRARLLRAFATFNLVTFVWIPFRAASLNDAGTLFGRMVLPGTPCCAEPTWGMAVVATVIAAAWLWQIVTEFADLRSHYLARPVPVKSTCYARVAVGDIHCGQRRHTNIHLLPILAAMRFAGSGEIGINWLRSLILHTPSGRSYWST